MLKQILQSGGKLFAVRGATVAVNFLSMLLLAYLIGMEDYGRFVMVWAGGNIAAALISLGLPVFLLREFAIRVSEGDNAVTRRGALVMGILVPAGLVGLGLAALWALQGAGFTPPFGQSAEILPLALALGFLLNLNTALSSAFHALGYQGFSMFQRDAMPQLLAISAALVATDLAGLVSALCVQMLVWLVLAIAVTLHKSRTRPLFGSGTRSARVPVAFWGSAVLGVIWAQVDVVVGGLFLGPAELGTYNILRRVANLAALPVTIATWATVGEFSRAFAARDGAAIAWANRKALILAVPPGLALVLLSVPLYPPLMAVYDLPGGAALFATYLVLLLTSAVVVCFAAGITILTSSGLERTAFAARLAGICVYLCAIGPLLAICGSALLANAVSVLLATGALGVVVQRKIDAVHGMNATCMELLKNNLRTGGADAQ